MVAEDLIERTDRRGDRRQSTRGGLGSSSTFEFARRRWVVNMTWVARRTGRGRIASQARQAARDVNFGARFFVVREGQANQFGLAWTGAGVGSGVASAAAAVAASLPNSLLALFELPDGRLWLLAIRNDLVLFEGDRVFDDADDALAKFESWRGLEWSSVIAPEKFALGGTEPARLEEFLEAKMRVPALIDAQSVWGGAFLRSRRFVYAVGIAAVGVLGIIGKEWYEDYQVEQARALARQRAELIRNQALANIEKPWLKASVPSVALRWCVEALGFQTFDLPGWEESSLVCDAKAWKVAATWKAIDGVGYLDQVPRAYEARGLKVAFVRGTGGQTVTAELVLRKPEEVRPQEDVISMVELQARLWNIGQVHGHKVSVGARQPGGGGQPQGVGPTGVPVRRPPQPVSLKTVVSPVFWGDALDTVPGLVIRQVTLNPGNREYEIEGEFYDREWFQSELQRVDQQLRAAAAQARR